MDGMEHRISKRHLFYGMARGFYQSTQEGGEVEITAASIMGRRLFRDKTDVAIAATSIALRGKNRDAVYRFHYTLDGSEPSVKSTRYTAPFPIVKSTTVKALVLKDGQPLMTIEERFEKGVAKMFKDHHLMTSEKLGQGKISMGKPFSNRPFDREVAGSWYEKGAHFELAPNGLFYGYREGKKRLIGYWWYDFPNDPFETPDDHGIGEIAWKNSTQRTRLGLTGRKNPSLILQTGSQRRIFTRKAPSAK